MSIVKQIGKGSQETGLIFSRFFDNHFEIHKYWNAKSWKSYVLISSWRHKELWYMQSWETYWRNAFRTLTLKHTTAIVGLQVVHRDVLSKIFYAPANGHSSWFDILLLKKSNKETGEVRILARGLRHWWAVRKDSIDVRPVFGNDSKRMMLKDREAGGVRNLIRMLWPDRKVLEGSVETWRR